MSDGFLARWTRRKLAARAAELAERGADTAGDERGPERGDSVARPAPPEGETAASAAPDAVAEPDATGPADPPDPLPELPDLDALTRESDLTPFLRVGVPTALRNAALRRMWSIDPAIRDFVSEAREYAYDWNSPGGVPGLGPLLPSDDVQAMLRKIIGGKPPEDAVSDADGRSAPDADRTLVPGTEPAAQEAGRVALAAAPEVPDLAPQPAPDAAPATGPAETVIETVAVLPPARAAPDPAAAPGSRLRRHGGAIPVWECQIPVADDQNAF